MTREASGRKPSRPPARGGHGVPDDPAAEPRRLTDAREMRALAHPLRIALLEALNREGPMTATAAGELLGESPANCSFHLRTLAKYGFIEEAPGGTGRERPWRRVAVTTSLTTESDEPEVALAAQELSRFFSVRADERRQLWEATQASYPPEWREASFVRHTLMYLTPDELTDVGEQITAVLDRYLDRLTDRAKRPADAAPVAVVSYGHPLKPTPSGN